MHKNPCVMDCFLNQTGIFQDAQVNKAVAIDVLGRLADDSTIGLLNEAIELCSDKQKHMQEMIQRDRPKIFPPRQVELDKNRCRPDAKLFFSCVQLYLYKHCPDHKLLINDECAQLREFSDKCMPAL